MQLTAGRVQLNQPGLCHSWQQKAGPLSDADTLGTQSGRLAKPTQAHCQKIKCLTTMLCQDPCGCCCRGSLHHHAQRWLVYKTSYRKTGMQILPQLAACNLKAKVQLGHERAKGLYSMYSFSPMQPPHT